MAKYYYNGVLLPEIPSDILAEYPYCWIRNNTTTGYYDLVAGKNVWYFNSNMYCQNGNDIKWYVISINGYENATEWTFNKDTTGNFGIDGSRTVMWSNHNVPNGSATSTTIYFYGTEPNLPRTKKYLVRSSGVLYTVAGGKLTSLNVAELTADVFKTYGFDEIPALNIFATLTDPELLYWQDILEDLPTITVSMSATTNPQTLLAEPFYMVDETIHGIDSVSCVYEGSPLIALSFNGGAFEYYNNGWVNASDTDGMLPDVLTAITSDVWEAKVAGVQSVQIRVILNTNADTLQTIKFKFINE